VRELISRVEEQWALVRAAPIPSNTRLALFVHGFAGNYLNTWGHIPDFLKEKCDSDPILRQWDYFFLGYDTRNVDTYLDIAGLIATIWLRASDSSAPYGSQYSRLALFGHSLGTLGIRQLLCSRMARESKLLEALHSVTLFGTPLNGSPIAWLGSWRYPIAEALKPRNPQLRMLSEWTHLAFQERPWPEVRLVLGLDDKVVGHEYRELITWIGDKAPEVTQLDHKNLVKPKSFDQSMAMDCLRRALT
jgi:hypothetical protein